MTTETAIQKAVRLAGGQSRLAAALGISQPSVAEWLKRKKVPATRAAAVAALSGVSREELRPDVFGEPSKKRAA